MTFSASSVRQPEEWPRAFTECLSAGDLGGMLALYETDACLQAPSGEVAAGHERIRAVLAGLIRSQARLESRVAKSLVTGDLALLYSDFDGTLIAPSGERRDVHQRAIEVLRRQSDGSWKLVFGDPVARGA
jgi:uncharacterized protein (TIGR02246 family)